MAANSYFPSVRDNSESEHLRSLFEPEMRSSTRRDSSSRRVSDAADEERLASLQAEAPAAWTRGLLSAPLYRPLEFFSMSADDGGPASQSDADAICEQSILLKEFELREMLAETPAVQEKIVQMKPCRCPPVRCPPVRCQGSPPVYTYVHSRPVVPMQPLRLPRFLPPRHIHWFWPRPPMCPHAAVNWQHVHVTPHLFPFVRWNRLHPPVFPSSMVLM